MKIFLGLPVYGGYDPHFVSCLLKLVTSAPFKLQVKTCIGDSLVARARNKLASDFLATDCTHLLFIDTDIIFTIEQLERLASHDEPVIAGFYPKKQRSLAWVMNKLDGEVADERGLLKVKYAGTGMLLIRRDVLERMIERFPEMAYGADDGEEQKVKYDFFATGVHEGADGRRRYLSEDWYFCQRILDMGIPIHMDTRVAVKHVGQFIYPLEDPFYEVGASPVEAMRMPEVAREDALKIFTGEYDVPMPRAPRTILDLGGNVGAFSLWAAAKWPDATIEAFEPLEENVKDFLANTKDCRNVTLHAKAVNARGGAVMLYLGENRMRGGLSTQPGQSVKALAVSATTLPSPEFIKLDVEGAELEILQQLDLSQTLAVAMETHSPAITSEVLALLMRRGMQIHSIAPTLDGCSLVKAVRAVDARS